MAIQFSVGDTITVNRTYVNNVLALRTPNTSRKALLEHLGRLGTSNLIVGAVDAASHRIRIIIIGSDSGRKAWTLYFETEDDLNQSFTMIQDITVQSHRVTVRNGSSKTIARGAFVVQTGWYGNDPQIAVVMAPAKNLVEKSAIFGIAEQDIFANQEGLVLARGFFSPINTSTATMDDSCFIGVENETIQVMAGSYYRNVAIVVNPDVQGTIYLPAQPAGPLTCMESRSVTGIGNNKKNTGLGVAGSTFKRVTTVNYADGVSAPVNKTNPRHISNVVFDQTESRPNSKNATDYLWIWGQFIDHDIALTETTSEPLHITVPSGDPVFPPGIIPLSRSEYEGGVSTARQQINSQSSFLDGTNVYGAEVDRATRIRAMDGTGRLRTSGDNLLPKNTTLLPNVPNNSDSLYYLAGDIRANETLTLLAMHTVFMREHNRLADQIRSANTHLTGDQVYQAARRYNIALMQHITYNEFLPLLLGADVISKYTGYNSSADPCILNSFATALYRLGHSMVSSKILRLDSNNKSIALGPTLLRDTYFRPDRLLEGGGIEPLLRGAAQQVCQEIDAKTVGELRNFLFGNPGSGGLDLAALNIQRGRDHGLPSYNQARMDLGLQAKSSYNQITSDSDLKSKLVSVYSNINEIDLWVGALAEDHVEGAMVGELIQRACKLQFEALRDGDRFWYEAIFAGDILAEIKATTLSDVIKRNTTINNELPANVFVKS